MTTNKKMKNTNAKLNAEIPEREGAIKESLRVLDESMTKLMELKTMLLSGEIRKNIDAVVMCNVIHIFFTEELNEKSKMLIDTYSKYF